MGWFKGIPEEDQKLARRYLCDNTTPDSELYKSFIALAMRSKAKYCIIPIQDYLGLDNDFRTNKPSTVGTNWRWRLKPGQLTDEMCREVLATTRLFGRYNPVLLEKEMEQKKKEEERKKQEELLKFKLAALARLQAEEEK